MTKNKKILISVAVAVTLLVAILGTIFDLQISKLLADISNGQYYSGNILAILGECFGEDVLYLLVIGSCAIIFFYLLKFPLTKKWLNYCLQALMCVVSYIVAVYSFGKTLNYVAIYTNFGLDNYVSSVVGKITILLLSVVIAVGGFLIISKLKPETIKNLLKWAILVLLVAVISNGIVQVSKHIFDRTRYRAMAFVGDDEFSNFTYWFSINKNKFDSISMTEGLYKDDFFKSFPSGHTCAAASIFLICFLPYYLNSLNTKKNKIILWSVASFYTFIIALSRIIAGAHFFMDTFIATLVTVVSIIAFYYLIEFLFKKFTDINKSKLAMEEQNNDSENNSKTNDKKQKDKTTKEDK